jgi:hypothetical protein
MSQGKPYLSQKYMPLQRRGRRTSWDQSTPYLSGSGHYSPDPWPTTVHCLNMSRSPTIGEWSEKSSDSANSSIIYATSASELPILRPKSEGYRRLSLRQKGGWNSPTWTSSCQTSVSSPDSSPEEGEIIEDTASNGAA